MSRMTKRSLPLQLLVALWAAGLLALGWSGCQRDSEPVPDDLRSVASACMRATACDVRAYARIGACLYTYSELHLLYGEGSVMGSIYECVNNADRCSQVEACFGAGEPCSSAFSAYCDGDTAVYCDLLDGVSYRYACGDHGLGCRVDPQISHLASCIPEDQATASAQGLLTSLQCDGTLCERTGEACDDNLPDACSGQHIVACLDGEIVLFNCHALGLENCIMEENDWGHCRAQYEAD